MKYCTRLLTFKEALDQKEWLKERAKGITGFEICGIIGIEEGKHPDSTWLEKTGAEEPVYYPNYKWTMKIREIIAEEFEATQNKKLTGAGLYQSTEYLNAIEIIDGFIEGEDAGLTCKSIKDRDGWESNNNLVDEIPLYDYMCAQWCMAITGSTHWYLSILFNESVHFSRVIERNEEAIEKLVKANEEFWNVNVKMNRIPRYDESSVMVRALSSKYSTYTSQKAVLQDGSYVTLCEDVLKMQDDLAKLKAAINNKTTRLKVALGKYQVALAGEYKIEWGRSTRVKFNEYKFKYDYPDLYKMYSTIDFKRPFNIYKYGSKAKVEIARQGFEKKYGLVYV